MKKLHFTLSLLELSTLINQFRAIVPGHRFKNLDSSSSESIIKDALDVKAIFDELPIADYSEHQSFFVIRLAIAAPKQLESNLVSSPLYEVYIGDIEEVLPVTREGKSIILQSNRLPGVILGEPIFETIWNEFFWDRYAYLALCTAFEYADVYVTVTAPEKVTLKSRISQLIILNESNSYQQSQDPFIEFLSKTLRYKRDTEKFKNNYDNESPIYLISDFFACASLDSEIRNKFKQTYSILKDEEGTLKSLSYILIHDKFNSIITELVTIFKCEKHHILGVLLFLSLRLAKQNGKCRSLSDVKDIIKSLNAFDPESTQFALILIGLSEPQSALIKFIHESKQSSYGIFSASPQKKTATEMLLNDDFFNHVRQELHDLKEMCTPTELKPDNEVDISLSKSISVQEEITSESVDINVLDTEISVASESEVEKCDTTSADIKDQENLPPLGVDQNDIIATDSILNSLDAVNSDEQNPPSENNSRNTKENKNQQHLAVESNPQIVNTLPDSDILEKVEVSVTNANTH